MQPQKNPACPPFLEKPIFSILVGLLLGDGTLYQTDTGKTSIKFEYSYKRKDHILHLHQLLKDWTAAESPSLYLSPKKGYKPHSYFFYTMSCEALNPLWDLFMKKGKKSIKPTLILDYLSVEGLAYWILDDGSLNKSKGYMTLHTEGFNKSEVSLICKELNQKFSLNTKPMEKKNYKNKNKPSYWIVYVPKASVAKLCQMEQLCKIIQSVSSLKHKLPLSKILVLLFAT